jgi:hypothetical protein
MPMISKTEMEMMETEMTEMKIETVKMEMKIC